MDCPICKNKNTKLIYHQYPGYIENLKYDIRHCEQCDTSFVFPNKIDDKLYD
jgi:transcriptional regulator NrdR family protein